MSENTGDRLALQVGQGVVLWCLRTWVAGLRREIDAPPRIRNACAGLGAPDAAPFLDGFVSAVGHGATRCIAVQCVSCPRLSGDERRLLDVIALAQEMRPFEALLILRGFMSSEGARAALSSAERAGAALNRAGCLLPAPGAAVQQFGLASAPDARDSPMSMAPGEW